MINASYQKLPLVLGTTQISSYFTKHADHEYVCLAWQIYIIKWG